MDPFLELNSFSLQSVNRPVALMKCSMYEIKFLSEEFLLYQIRLIKC